MDLKTALPSEVRALIRTGEIDAQTSGMCTGYAQANMAVLPKDLAFDFLLFTQRNKKPCPVLDVTEVGSPVPKLVAPMADLRHDIPRYRIYRYGELTDEVTDVEKYWRDDLVAFLLGCRTDCRKQNMGLIFPDKLAFFAQCGQLTQSTVIHPQSAFIAVFFLVADRNDKRCTLAARCIPNCREKTIIQKICQFKLFHLMFIPSEFCCIFCHG